MALTLAKRGYWGGDPGKVRRAPADEVLKVLQFEEFSSDYEQAYLELNTKEGK